MQLVVPGECTPRLKHDDIIRTSFELNDVIRTFRDDNSWSYVFHTDTVMSSM